MSSPAAVVHGRPVARALRDASAVALTIGALDLAAGLRSPAAGAAPSALVLPFLATTVAAFALYLVVRTLLRGAPGAGAAAAVPVVVLAGALLAWGFDGFGAHRLAVVAVLAVGGAWLAARLVRWMSALPEFEPRARAAAFVAPLLALAGAAAVAVPELVDSTGARAAAFLGIALALLAALAAAARGRTPALAAPAAALALAVALAVHRGGPTPAEDAPTAGHAVKRVILITIDTLRADSLSCYADGGARTPAIDALAADATLFEAARSTAPWTMPAVASLLTGVAPEVHLVSNPRTRLPEGVPTLAERLARAGYRTASFGKNVVLLAPSGLQRGFQESHFFPELRPATPIGSRLLADALGVGVPALADAPELVERASAWIEAHRGDDFFLWLHLLDPHVPYEPPAAFAPKQAPPPGMSRRFARGEEIRSGRWAPTLAERAWIRALYDGEVRSVDAALARFFERLRALGLYEDSLIVLTVDHGEEFWDHGGFEHGQSLHDELVRVPLLVKPPGPARPARSALAVSNAAVPATVLEICGLAPQAAEFSWGPLLARESGAWVPVASAPPASTDPLFFDPRSAIVVDGLKYVRDSLTGVETLFDLGADPGELRPLDPSDPLRLEQARAALAEHERRAQELRERLGIRGAGQAGLGEAALDMMRQLGYVR